MDEEIRVLATALQSRDEQLGAVFVTGVAHADGIRVELLEPWQGAAGTSLPQQLFTLHEVLLSIVDAHAPSALAVRRPESGGRGGPTLAYDAKISAMGIAALVARERRLRFVDLRAIQLDPKPTADEVDQHCPAGPKIRRELQLNAVAAALTTLGG